MAGGVDMAANAMQAAFAKAYGDKKILNGGLQVNIQKVNRERRTKVMRDLRRLIGDFPYELHRDRLEKMKLYDLFELRSLGRKGPGTLREALMVTLRDDTKEEATKLVDKAVRDGKVEESDRYRMISEVTENSLSRFEEEARKIATLKAKEREALSKAKKESHDGKAQLRKRGRKHTRKRR